MIVALDPSVTATGCASTAGVRTIIGRGQGMARLARLRDEIRDAVAAADVVIIEGYSFGSPRGAANRAHQLGELGGMIRLMLHDLGIPYVDVPPANLKQFACGKGNASKDDVFAAAIRRLGYPGSSKDEADALWLYAMAAAHYLHVDVLVPAGHRAALVKVAWPNIPGQAAIGSDVGGDGAPSVNGKEMATRRSGSHPSAPPASDVPALGLIP